MFRRTRIFLMDNWKFLLFLVLFYFAMNYEFPYVIYSPGGSINMSERVTGDNTYSEKGSLSMTYVSLTKGTLPFLGLSYIIPNWDIVDKEKVTYSNSDLEKTVAIDKIYMNEAISNAELNAYVAAGIDYQIKTCKNVITIVSENSNTKMKYNDELITIDDMRLNGIKGLQDYVKGKKPGDIVKVKFIRDGKEEEDEFELIDSNGTTKVGVGLANICDYETEYNINVKTKSSESGPSGGLMTALEIYNKITEEDITKGLKIMGTGTIEKDGTVGEIGGVKYKLLGAVKKGAEVFICPKGNYDEALQVQKTNNLDIQIIYAETFMDALEKLEGVEA